MLTRTYPFKFRMVEVVVNFIVFATVASVITTSLIQYQNQTNSLTGDWLNHHPVEWILQSETRNGGIVPRHIMKIYFGSNKGYAERDDEGITPTDVTSYNVDKKKGKIMFFDNNDNLLSTCDYQLLADTGLKIKTLINEAKSVRIFKKQVMKQTSDLGR